MDSEPCWSDVPPRTQRAEFALYRSYVRQSFLDTPVVATRCRVGSGQRTACSSIGAVSATLRGTAAELRPRPAGGGAAVAPEVSQLRRVYEFTA